MSKDLSSEATGSPVKSVFPLPDLAEVPRIGSPEREAHEAAAMARGEELLRKNNGSIRDSLFDLDQEIRDYGRERSALAAYNVARAYSRLLVDYVEQCWATAVLR